MGFSISPKDFADARFAGASSMREASIGLVRSFVDKRLIEMLKSVKNGQVRSNTISIRVDPSVTHGCEFHVYAIKAVVDELKLAEFRAKYVYTEAYDDGPVYSSPEFHSIEIQL